MDSSIIFQELDRQGISWAVGRHNEPRRCYTTPQFQTDVDFANRWRTIHLGIDLFAAAGTIVSSPWDGTIESICDNAIPGDYAMVEADGTVTMLGRGSVSINTGGEKVYPEEVEGALKGHPDVFDALVVGVPDDRYGQHVAAVVAPRKGAKPTLAALDTFVRTQIAGYKVPRSLWIVDQIKRSPAGKPDYKWAKEQTEQRAADEVHAKHSGSK